MATKTEIMALAKTERVTFHLMEVLREIEEGMEYISKNGIQYTHSENRKASDILFHAAEQRLHILRLHYLRA